MTSRRNRITANLVIPENLIYFSGHFPGAPILPGVAQIRFVTSLIGRHLESSVMLTRLSRVKFTAPISPGDQLKVEITLMDNNQASWQIENGRRTASRGKLAYRADRNETGIPI